MINLAVFASGNGSNAENLISYFQRSDQIRVVAIFCNNPKAGVLQRAKKLHTQSKVFNKADLDNGEVLAKLKDLEIDAIVLAGFLLKIPETLIQEFEKRIINIHPSLLPKYGGKGMYGDYVHAAVLENGDQESGITIHLVNEEFDKGRILFQAKCDVKGDDTPSSLAQRVHELEYRHFPEVVNDYFCQTL